MFAMAIPMMIIMPPASWYSVGLSLKKTTLNIMVTTGSIDEKTLVKDAPIILTALYKNSTAIVVDIKLMLNIMAYWLMFILKIFFGK